MAITDDGRSRSGASGPRVFERYQAITQPRGQHPDDRTYACQAPDGWTPAGAWRAIGIFEVYFLWERPLKRIPAPRPSATNSETQE